MIVYTNNIPLLCTLKVKRTFSKLSIPGMKSSESKFKNCLYFTSNALARKVEKMAIESWKPVGLSPSHGYLLMLVNQEPGLQPGSIADHLQLTPSTVTRLVEKLEEKKLVVRT